MKVDSVDGENLYKEDRIIRDAAAFSGTLYFSQGLYIIRGFIIAHVLGPATYGVWSIFRSFFASAPYLGLGTQQAMLRQVPFSIGEGKTEKKGIIIQTALSWNILLSSIVMILAFLFSFTGFASEYRGEIRLAGVLFVLNAVHLFMRPRFKSEQKILLLSKYILAYAVLNSLFGLILLYIFRLNGLLLGMIIAQVILFTYLLINNHLSLHLYIDKKTLKELFHVGFPIMILLLLIFLMGNIDKFIVFFMLGKTSAGYYGLAAFVSSMVSYISYTISTVIFPRMMYIYGKTGDRKHIEKYFTKPIIVLSGLVPIILGIIYINIEAVIKFFLPRYLPGIAVLHILIAALFFSTVWGLPTNFLIALNKQKKFMYLNTFILFISIILDIAAVLMGFGMNGVAAVTTFIFFLSSAAANSYALFLLKNNISRILKRLSIIYLPFIYSFIGMVFIVNITVSENILINNLFKSIIYLIFSFPLFLYIEKEIGITGKIFSSLKVFKHKNF